MEEKRATGRRRRKEEEAVKMIVEKPVWLRHEGLQIFSVDIQPTGHRFATAGGDHKVNLQCFSRKQCSCCVCNFSMQ